MTGPPPAEDTYEDPATGRRLPHSPSPLTGDGELWGELRTVAARVNRHDADLLRRAELYEALRDRGYMLKEIAEAAGSTDAAVSWVIHKRAQERAGTWDRKRAPKAKRRRRARADDTYEDPATGERLPRSPDARDGPV